MFSFLKNQAYSIGVDLGDDGLKLVQLENNGKGINLVAGSSKNLPRDVKPNSGNWQRWAIDTIREMTANGAFRGKNIIAAMPASDVFIDHIKMPKTKDDKIQDAIFSKIKQKLPFEPVKENTMIKYVPAEQDNLLVMATERKIIDRHLAVYEKADLQIKSIGVWPLALTNIYTTFFGRRKTDFEAIVMLACIEANCMNVAICRHKNLLFARSIPIGAKQLNDEKIITRLVLELTACKRQFASMYRNIQIERLVFLSGRAVEKDTCAKIAKQLEMPAQMGDCMAAVEIPNPYHSGIDRRDCHVSWAVAFGLSLS